MATLKYRLGSTFDVDQTLSWGAKIEKKDSRKPNILKFAAIYSNTPQLGDEVLYYNTDNVQKFGGFIQKITDVNTTNQIEVADYSVELSQNKINTVYENMSPEAIIEDIITNETGMTYVSSVSTGITITRVLFRDEWLIDAITKMMELFSGAYKVDLLKNFTLFVNADSLSTEMLTYGTDRLQNGWITDNQKRAEKVVVIGAFIDQRTTETLSGTGTEFFTSFIPENVEISGLTQTTETISGDYEVDIYNKKITFNSSQSNPVVSYTYKSQIRVELGTGKTVVLEKKYIESKLEARKLAIEYRTRFEDGAQSAKWLKVSSDIENFNVGDLIYVTDEVNNKSGNYQIERVEYTLPNTIVVALGEPEEDLFDWQKETVERIKQLERTNNNSNFITQYEFIQNDVKITVQAFFTELFGVTDNGSILFASETTLASNADLISDTGIDDDYALAYDDKAIPTDLYEDYLNNLLVTEDGDQMITEDGDELLLEVV